MNTSSDSAIAWATLAPARDGEHAERHAVDADREPDAGGVAEDRAAGGVHDAAMLCRSAGMRLRLSPEIGGDAA